MRLIATTGIDLLLAPPAGTGAEAANPGGAAARRLAVGRQAAGRNPVAHWGDGAPLDRLLAQCRRQGVLAVLLLVELQGADPALQEPLQQAVALRLRARVRACDAVAHAGRGSVAVLLHGIGELLSHPVRERLEADLRQPYALSGHAVQPLLRIGRAVPGLDGERAATLLRVAAVAAR